ncbi:MAG: PEP-CTERM sorting domain-containing protein [Alphaproteobacteria bacterium]|nr:PEP-CTERM sorting domain-containing protein [Alphaproteobacteria bacterium]
MTGTLRDFSVRILSAAAVAAALVVGLSTTPAHALVVPWSGAGSSGIDGAPTTNLGDNWQLTGGNMIWAITPSPSNFNSANYSNSFGTFATAFQFTINSGVAGIGSAQLDDITTGQIWNTAISLASQRVLLTAPSGAQLSEGDQYTLDINFTGAADPSTFSFAALWSDSLISSTSVPEPGTLSLFGVAVLALVAMRRRLFAAI